MPNPVTFLFSDIEGSTRLWEEQPDAMESALERHDRRARRIIAKHGGTVFKTVGDAFYTVFPNVRTAAQAAIEGQRRLSRVDRQRGLSLKVRMAIHSGMAQERDGDYFGAAVNRVARLLSLGNGGQILLSRQAREALFIEPLQDDVEIDDLGIHRLRDLAQPEHVFQILTGDARTQGSLKPLSTYPNNLPIQISSFIGREKELADCRVLVRDHRLLTLTGAGGSGKTRLALQLAMEMLGPDGAFLVEFASINSAENVALRIASIFDQRESAPGASILDSVVEYLRYSRALLVLDNCEHVIEAAADAVHQLLSKCPLLKIIVTSRETLGLAGENVYIVRPLDVPMSDEPGSLDELIRFESVRLFVERATAINSNFALTNENAPAIFEICRALEGVPLAIELAAARSRLMSPEQIAERLDDRFRLLTVGDRSSLPRQQTLRSLIDWSYNLLSTEEKTLLDSLSVFIGGWTIEAAEEVCHSSQLPKREVFDLLSRLVDKSLVQYEEWKDEGIRYRLLGTIRQYAQAHLLEKGLIDQIRCRHLEYFANLAESGSPYVRIGDAGWLRRISREHDNIRLALDFDSTSQEALQNQIRLAAALTVFWSNRGHLTEGRQRFERALSRGRDLGPAAKAPALLGAAVLEASQLNYPRALEMIGEAVDIWRSLDDPTNLAHGLLVQGNILIQVRRFEEASAAYEEGNEIRIRLGDRQGLAVPLNNLGYIAVQMGDLEKAIPLVEQSIAICREFESRQGLIAATHSLAVALKLAGRYLDALEVIRESLQLAWELGHWVPVALRIETTAEILAKLGDSAEAVRLFSFADRLRDRIQQPIPKLEVARLESALDELRATMEAEEFADLSAQGAGLEDAEAIRIALGTRTGV